MNKATIRLSQNLQKIARKLEKEIEKASGENIGFTLLIYTEGRASYVSNVDRTDSIRELKYLLELWEQGMPDILAHEYSD